MSVQTNFAARIADFKASKAVLFWSCAGAAVAVMIVGFGWGGWVTGGTAQAMAEKAATAARAEVVATICVNRFAKSPDATAQLVSLKKIDSWKRSQMLEEGGWVTLPGTKTPVEDAAALCADRLVGVQPAGTSG
jgi:alpha/beta superfamily hydrolase